MKQGRFITVFAGIAAIVMLLVSMVMPQTAMASAVGDAWVHKVTYNAATPTVTYLHSSIVRKINVTDPMADDGLLSIDDAYADEITSTYKTVAGVATIPMRSVYVAGSWVPIYIQNPGTEWRAEADREHRLRYQTARSPLATSPVTTNYIGMRNYSPSTFGQNYTLGETWSYTEQVDSSNDIGDSTVTVNVTVAGATESVTVPAGTFTCYKVVRQYPGANPNGLDNTVTEWWEVDTAEHFCHAPIKTVDNHNFRYSQTSELNSKTLTTAGMCGWPDEDPPDPCAYDFDGDGYNICQECDDSDPNVNPGALELCDGIDNDCDGLIDEGDIDGDGTPDCSDLCPTDPAKIAPGRCGCGVPDTDCGEGVGDSACYAVSYSDGTNPPTSELRLYVGTETEAVDYATLEAFLGMPIDDQEALRVDAEFVGPVEPFRIANIVVPMDVPILEFTDWRSTANGALLQEYMHVYSTLELEPGVPLGDIDLNRWPLWTVAPDFSSGNGNYYGYPNFVGQSGPMAQMNIAIFPGMAPVFWGEYYQCDVTAQEEVAGVDCLKVEYTLTGNDMNSEDPRMGTVVIEEWYPVPGDPRNPVLAPIKRVDSMNYVGTETQERYPESGPCVPEAATVAMMSIGLVGLGSFVWFRKRRFSLPSA